MHPSEAVCFLVQSFRDLESFSALNARMKLVSVHGYITKSPLAFKTDLTEHPKQCSMLG